VAERDAVEAEETEAAGDALRVLTDEKLHARTRSEQHVPVLCTTACENRGAAAHVEVLELVPLDEADGTDDAVGVDTELDDAEVEEDGRATRIQPHTSTPHTNKADGLPDAVEDLVDVEVCVVVVVRVAVDTEVSETVEDALRVLSDDTLCTRRSEQKFHEGRYSFE
jgi:hypothetical protein